jgi:hypothetical protein
MIVKLAGKNAVATIDGTPTAVTGGSYRCTSGTDDMTNLLSEGYGENIDTIKNAGGTLDCAYDGDNPPDFDEGDETALSIAIPGKTIAQHPPAGLPSGPGFSGMVRVTVMNYTVVDPNGGVRYSFDWISNGPYTKTVGGVIPT